VNEKNNPITQERLYSKKRKERIASATTKEVPEWQKSKQKQRYQRKSIKYPKSNPTSSTSSREGMRNQKCNHKVRQRIPVTNLHFRVQKNPIIPGSLKSNVWI
jgi:hypothetical protein